MSLSARSGYFREGRAPRGIAELVGYRAYLPTNVGELVFFLTTRPIDVIVLDDDELNDILVTELRTQETLQHLYVILVTASSRRNKAHAVLHQPVNLLHYRNLLT